jgi:hypothetical protein
MDSVRANDRSAPAELQVLRRIPLELETESLDERGLDPSDAADSNAHRKGDGWTHLEEYVNSLAP